MACQDRNCENCFPIPEDKTDQLEEAIELLEDLEWSSYQRGQGSGYMSSNDDGPMIKSCPICKGIDPNDKHRGDFVESVHGHRDDCQLKKVIRKYYDGQ